MDGDGVNISSASAQPEIRSATEIFRDLVKYGSEFENSADPKLKNRHHEKILHLLKAVCNLYFPGDLVSLLQAGHPVENLKKTINCILVFLDSMHEWSPLSTDFVKWLLSKLLLCKTSTVIMRQLEGLMEGAVLRVARYLSSSNNVEFLTLMIHQLHALNQNMTTISICENSADPFYCVVIPVSTVNGSRVVLLETILDVIRHGAYDMSAVSMQDILILWKVVCSEYLTAITSLRTKCVRLWHLLMTKDLGNWLVCRIAFDHMFKMESIFFKTRAAKNIECFDSLKDAHNMFIQAVMDRMIRFEEYQSLKNLDVDTMVTWASTAADLALKYPNNNKVKRLEQLVVTISLTLSRFTNNQSFFSQDNMKNLADTVQILAERELKNEDISNSIPVLSNYYSFLLRSDDATQSSVHGKALSAQVKTLVSKCAMEQSHWQSIRTQWAAVAALINCKVDDATRVLEDIAPDENQLIIMLDGACRGDLAAESIKELFSMIGDLAKHSSRKPALSVAFLTLPWLRNPQLQLEARRHWTSIPLLRDLHNKFRKEDVVFTACVQECTMGALMQMKEFPDWRRTVLVGALGSDRPSIVQCALEHVHSFVGLNASSAEMVVKTTVNLIDRTRLQNCDLDLSHVLSALSRCLCSVSKLERRHVLCEVCKALQSTGEERTITFELPEDMSEKLVALLNDLRQFDKQTRLDLAQLLFCILSHCGGVVGMGRRLAEASLCLLQDEDADVRHEYEYVFKVLVKSRNGLDQNELKSHLQLGVLGEHASLSSVIQAAAEAHAPFFEICVKNSPNSDLQEWAFLSLFAYIFEYQVDNLQAAMKRVIVSLSENDNPSSPSVIRVFHRRVRLLSEQFIMYLLPKVDEALQYGEPTNCIDELIDEELHILSQLFDINSVENLLRICSLYMVSSLFLNKDALDGAATILLDRIRNHLRVSSSKLTQEVFPAVLELQIRRRLPSTAKHRDFIKAYAGYDLAALCDFRRYQCTLFLLRSLAADQTAALDLLERINERHLDAPFSLTALLKFKCEYLGQLLSFRRCINDDAYWELRPLLIRSLAIIIEQLEPEFLANISNKMLVLLRAATNVGVGAISVWLSFVRQLSSEVLAALLPQILIDIQPLLEYSSADELLDVIFHQRQLDMEQSESFERTILVLSSNEGARETLLDRYIRKFIINNSSNKNKIVRSCVRMLMEECGLVAKVVLRKLFSLLDGNPLSDDVAADLVPALMHTIRTCTESELRMLAAQCLGRLSAIDPGRVGLSLNARKEKLIEPPFIDDDKFFVDLLERTWRVYSNVLDGYMIDKIEYALQELLKKLVRNTDSDRIMEKLSAECRRDIEPLRSTTFIPNNDNSVTESLRPVIQHVKRFQDWINVCFSIGLPKVRGYPFCDVFKSLMWVVPAGDTTFNRHVLAQLVLRLIIENHESMILEYVTEFVAVLRFVLISSNSWVQQAAHVVFAIVDVLERFILHRKSTNKQNDKELERTQLMLNKLIAESTDDGSLILVAAAEKCQCLYRALRWCEHYGIKKDTGGCDVFDQHQFYTLERLHSSLHDIDGVLGAFECLAAAATPSADERILALEAVGDYHEALPLYPHSSNNKEMRMIKGLLRLNQPELALNTAISCYEECSEDRRELLGSLEAAQLEAAWHLRNWTRLDNMVQKQETILLGRDLSWGASCASILCAVKRKTPDVLAARLHASRQRVVDKLTAMTIEDSDTYAQAYKYISHLHILEEMEDGVNSLELLPSTVSLQGRGAIQLKPVLKKWKARSECAVQCASVLEPMLRMRRELLRASAVSGVEEAVSQLLVQSCRLARQAGHLQIAWTFLVEAKSLDVNHKEVGMEEARFAFQKGNQSQAIGLLSKLLTGRFADTNQVFTDVVGRMSQGGSSVSGAFSRVEKEEKSAFAEVQLLRAEYMLKAGACSYGDLYQIYVTLQKMDVPSGDLHYRVATFLDNMYSLDEKPRSDILPMILMCYSQVLSYGRSHLYHAMPRMLTLWFDVTQAKHDDIMQRKTDKQPGSADLDKRDKEAIVTISKQIMQSYKQLDPYMFYSSFPQLISRIVHPDENVFNTLKTILADLIGKYPHQCLWQSISVYRSALKSLRQIRCTQVFDVVRKKSSTANDLIDQYDYIAGLLVKFAEAGDSPGRHTDISVPHHTLYEFFASGVMYLDRLTLSVDRKLGKGVRKVSPTVLVPLTEMFEHALPTFLEAKVSHFSQIQVSADTPQELDFSKSEVLPTVLVQSIDKTYLVLNSLQRPKRISLRSMDGKRRLILCKKNDELRKDARFMDFNGMMNMLMRQNADARRRQLAVRTYSVIPLQNQGGLMEWLDNLSSYRAVLTPLLMEYSKRYMTQRDVEVKWKHEYPVERIVSDLHNIYYPAHPLVMAEWFRRQFAEPSSWHFARCSFARSNAVISMIGFILGLGDRHCENIMIDMTEGCVVHVDYNLIFNKGETLPIKEVVPFRLTRNMVNGLGPTGVEGPFRRSCEATLRVMRDNKNTLLSVIETFAHDPLVEWQDVKAQQLQRVSREPYQQKKTVDATAAANEVIGLVKKRLDGHIVSPMVFRQKYNSAPMSLEGQVAKLIEISRDERNLARMFVGWSPYM